MIGASFDSTKTPLQDLLASLLDWIETTLLAPGLTLLKVPDVVRGFLLDGVWMGVATVATFLPIIFDILKRFFSIKIDTKHSCFFETMFFIKSPKKIKKIRI